jgi:hypothetical protein
MPESHIPTEESGARPEVAEAFARADHACTFGPSFFIGYLGNFVRDHCPEATEPLPLVELRLASGETVSLCHVVGVSPRWVMLAVPRSGSHGSGMRIELLPYELICSVCIRPRETGSGAIGFDQIRAPEVIAPETLVRAAMAHDHAGGAL